MKEQKIENQKWQTPEIIDLDLNETKSGTLPSMLEITDGIIAPS